ncbi:hypothetical protein LTR78_004013 [Recurvomyces mirabilis]|uniref:Plastocyanin-like domain-containing protein n=1 Tax=Recurvomyces mirabilis TaxID=574656 RepID=A0AAE0WRE6_9PEZI|nr:hypothetical protein LTR78_004013 [Recurvomyces mirabilis]KAK5153848.1 hypothetical protein LTS14_007068 [Recurvomyces mirabilis]
MAPLLSKILAFVLPLTCITVVEAWGGPPSGQGHGQQFNRPKLSQQQTNGQSDLGSLNAPRLSPFIDGPHPNGSPFPWGDRNASNCNPYDPSAIPNTGVTRHYQWTVTNTTLAPDGVQLPMLVANGAFPGPVIEANWGDWIEVAVTNGLEIEGTAIHWHGFLQTGTPYMDGTPGVSQCPIAPGKTFTYRFRAELYGTSWWHGHYSAQ